MSRFCRGYRAGHIVKAMGLVACFLLYSHTRRFPRLRFPSEIGVDCPGFCCGVSCPSSFLHASSTQPPCLVFPIVSYRLSRSSVRLVSSVERLVSPSCSLRRQPRRGCLSFAWRFRSSLSIRAVFVSSISHRLLITIVEGRCPGEQINGASWACRFIWGIEGNAIGERRRGMRRKMGRDG